MPNVDVQALTNELVTLRSKVNDLETIVRKIGDAGDHWAFDAKKNARRLGGLLKKVEPGPVRDVLAVLIYLALNELRRSSYQFIAANEEAFSQVKGGVHDHYKFIMGHDEQIKGATDPDGKIEVIERFTDELCDELAAIYTQRFGKPGW